MTDRHAGYVVTLGDAIREDDAEDIITAISMIKGVISVEPIKNDVSQIMAESKAKHDLTRKLFSALED